MSSQKGQEGACGGGGEAMMPGTGKGCAEGNQSTASCGEARGRRRKKPAPGEIICLVCNLPAPAFARGACEACYQRLRYYGLAARLPYQRHRKGPGKTGCSVPLCDRRHHGKGMCKRHFMRLWYAEKHPKRTCGCGARGFHRATCLEGR